MSEQVYEQLTLFPADSHASPFLSPGSDEARMMTVTSGQRCSELLRKSSPLGLLAKMLLESSTWHSTLCWLTWNFKATKQGRLYFQLVASTPRISDTDAPLWPTPAARDCKEANSMEHLQREGKRNHADQLANAVKLWPTVTASDYRARGPNSHQQGLPEAVRMWPTPTSRSGTGPSQTETRQGGMDLQTAAALWPTPTVIGNYSHLGSGPKAGTGLPTAAKLYPTPTPTERTSFGEGKPYVTATGSIRRKNKDGSTSNMGLTATVAGNGGQLNPEWVEAMMGFPIGWTASEPDGQTGVGSSESPA